MDLIEKKYHIVLIGGGHSNAQLLKFYAMKPCHDLQITLISDQLYAPYSGMLPGYLGGWYSHDDIHFDLYKLSKRAGVRFIHTRVTGIDAKEKVVNLKDRPDLKYDVCSINIGSTPTLPENYTSSPSVIPLKPIPQLLQNWTTFINTITNNPKPYKIIIVGGGASGIEVCLGLAKRFKKLNLKLTIIDSHKKLLSTHNSRVRRSALKELQAFNVNIFTNESMKDIKGKKIILNSDKELDFDFCFLASRAKSQNWFKESGLPTDENGFLQVDKNLSVANSDGLFGAGDCIAFSNYNLPKAGIFAVRQGKPLFENINNYLLGKKLTPYKPQKRFLSLLTTGERKSIASYGPFSWSGSLVWDWKNSIDITFMDKFARWKTGSPTGTPTRLVPKTDSNEMICGNNESRAGASRLSTTIKKLNNTQNVNFEDATILPINNNKSLIAPTDFSRSFTDDPYLFGYIVVNHSLSSFFAMGIKAKSALADVVLEKKSEKLIQEDFHQLMSGAQKALEELGCTLSGSHISFNSEMLFSLNVLSDLDNKSFMLKENLKVGESLILTKAIGTGIVLRAHMDGECSGFDLKETIDSMKSANFKAITILKKYNVKACTDVTGFGLLGHLKEMTDSSNAGVHIFKDTIPLLAGTLAYISDGYISPIIKDSAKEIVPQVKYLTKTLTADELINSLPQLLDPQTSGGLLFSVKTEDAMNCLNELQNSSYPEASIIGSVKDNSGSFINIS